MKSIYKYIFTVVALFAVTATFGQSVHDLRLNEMMIKNVDNYADEYGRHVPAKKAAKSRPAGTVSPRTRKCTCPSAAS